MFASRRSSQESLCAASTSTIAPLTAAEIERYDRYFVLLDKSRRGVVSIDEAWLLFEKPRLQLEQLDIIWNLVSVGPDNLLTLPKFRVAVHLARLANQGTPLPATLPADLAISAEMYNELRAFKGCASAVQAIDAPKLSLCKADRNSYDDCFKMLDIRNRGVVSIDEAVPLFRRAKINDESLNDIFDLAEVGDDNLMTLPKFRVAMHLAAKLVCGYDLPETLPESLARSAGIVGGGGGRNSSPMSIPSWIQLRGTGWAMTPEKRAKYTEVFRVKLGLGEGGHAQRQQAVRLFKRSKLPQDEIDRIWRLADANRDQQLSLDEFCNAMHLVTLRKSGTDLPPELPSELMSDDVKWELTLDHSMNFGEQFRALAGGQHPALSQDAVRQHLAQYGQPTQYVSRVLEMVSPYGQTVDEPHFCMANLLMLRLMSGEPMPSALPERVREQLDILPPTMQSGVAPSLPPSAPSKRAWRLHPEGMAAAPTFSSLSLSVSLSRAMSRSLAFSVSRLLDIAPFGPRSSSRSSALCIAAALALSATITLAFRPHLSLSDSRSRSH